MGSSTAHPLLLAACVNLAIPVHYIHPSVAGEMSYLGVNFHCSRQRICPLITLSINGKSIQQFKLQEIQMSRFHMC